VHEGVPGTGCRVTLPGVSFALQPRVNPLARVTLPPCKQALRTPDKELSACCVPALELYLLRAATAFKPGHNLPRK